MLRPIHSIVNIILVIVEFLLTLRFIFIFFQLNPHTPFVSWIYGNTELLVSPFARILPNWYLGSLVVDFTTLAALLVYSLIGYLILEIVSYI